MRLFSFWGPPMRIEFGVVDVCTGSVCAFQGVYTLHVAQKRMKRCGNAWLLMNDHGVQ